MSLSSAASPIPGRFVARTASVHIDNACNNFLQDCFRQFGIHVQPITGDAAEVFQKQKFEACVLRLYDPEAERVLRAARGSPSNKRMVIYGIARNTQEALRFSSYGINAILDEPLERQSVLKAVKATHLLVIHELRRYARIPVVGEAQVDSGNITHPVMMVEISSGGMSVRTHAPMPASDPVRVGFALPGMPKLNLRAYVCWSRPGDKVVGLRFDPADDRRLKIRDWIDQYLEIV